MNYIVPYIGGNVDYIIIPIAGTITVDLSSNATTLSL